MSLLIYNIFIRLYEWAVMLLATQNEKAALWYLGRKDIFKKIEKAISEGELKTERIWMHCASLGEFEQGRPLLETMRKEKPEALIILTFFSPSGYEPRKNYPNADHVFYLPIDTKNNARRFLYLIRPTLVVFVKYEFWYHYFNEIHKLGIQFILISALFRKKHIFFKWYGSLHRKMLSYLSYIFVQDDASVILLNKIGVNNITQINDTRVDRVMSIANASKSLPTMEMFLSGNKALVVGSAYETENDMVYQANSEKLISSKIIIVPHNVDVKHIQIIQQKWGDDAFLYSNFNEKDALAKKVLIVDTVGMLSSIYKYADIAIVGGGFGKGIHSTLEPAAFGIPVLFGPKYQNFREAREMIGEGAAFSFERYQEFSALIIKLQNVDFKNITGQKSKTYIESHTGGTERVLEYLRRL